MKVVIRVDSSHQIGAGHVMRCMALAKALQAKEHIVTFICRELPGNLIFLLKEHDFSVISLPYDINTQHLLSNLSEYQQWLGISVEKDLKENIDVLAKIEKIDWLIVDHYALDFFWESACRSYVKRIMIIDDLANRIHDADILLDQNYYSNSSCRYKSYIPDHCKLLIGPCYALLRAEFSEARKNCIPRNGEVKRLMVSLGGSDYHNATQKILEGIYHSHYRNLPVDVVIGATNQHRDKIQKWCAERKNYHFHCPSKNIAEIMKNADFAIGGGGTTTWERCCLGLPSLVVRMASNQDELIWHGLSANIFDQLGDITKLNEMDLAKKLDETLRDSKKQQMMSKNGMELVDGLGVNRVIWEMITEIRG